MKLSKKILFYVKFGSVFYFTMSPVVQGNPTGADVVAGGASIADLGGVLNVTTATDKTVINWNSFSIGSGEIANFIQPNSTSATLNRVIGDMPSDIAGQLISNGRVGLINPNGILITKEGSINTNGFFASTLNLSDSDFLGTGKLTFKGESESIVSNSGNILARQGDVFLIGRNVQNSGTIETKDGNVALAAGSEVTLMKAGDGRLSVRIPVDSKKGSVSHSGAIKAVQQTLKNNDGNPYILGMNVDSSAEMTPEDFMNAQVAINAGSGRAEISGTITAGSQSHGGEITVEASEVETTSTARIDVSGDFGGGSVKIGGGLQGNDATMSNAKINWVQTGALLTADARVAGDGGTVIVWSDVATGFGGTISAKGGALSGDGGFAEISGKQWLGLGGLADLTAANGSTGTLLLDPTDIILTGAGVDAAPTFGSFSGADPRTFGGGANNSSVISIGTGAGDTNATLLKQLATASVIITTSSAGGGTGNITVSDVISYTSANALTLTADNSIFINDDITNNGAGSLTFTANGTGGVNIGANITAAGAGSISITSGTGGISQLGGTTVDAGSGTILVDGNDGSISLPGALTTTNNSATAVRIIDASTVSVGNISTGASGTVMLGGLAVDSITGTVGQTGIINAGTLIGNTGDSVSLIGANTLTNLGSFTTNGNFELINSSALTLTGNLATSGATASLTSSSGLLTLNADINTSGFGVTLNGVGVDQTGGSIFATTATVNGGTGSIALNSLLNNFTGGVTLNATGASVSVRDANALILSAPTISATTSLTALAGTTLTLPAFDFTSGSSINFQSSGGSLITTGLISASGSNSVTLVGSTGLTVAHDITTVTGNVSLTGAGVTLNAAITVDAGSGEILIDGNDGAIVLTGDLTTTNNTANAVRIIDGTTASVGNITTGTTGTVLLGGVGADILTSTVTQTGTINTGNHTVNTGSSVTLSTINADGDLQINSAGSINFTGVTDVGGNLLANTIANGGVGASITDTGAGQLLITGTTGLTAGNGSITLNDGDNNFTGVVTVTTTGAGNVILEDTNDISLGASTIGGSLNINVDDDIFLSGAITTGTTQTYQDDVFLSGNTILTGTTLSHTGIDGGSIHDLTLDFSSTTDIPDSIVNINNFTAQKAVLINGTFTTVGNQTYNGNVVTSGNRTLNGGVIRFNAGLSINGDDNDKRTLTINGDVIFGAASNWFVNVAKNSRDQIIVADSKNVTITAGATLSGRVNGNGFNVGNTALILTGTALNVSGAFNAPITLVNQNVSATYAGNVLLTKTPSVFIWDGGGANSLWSTEDNWVDPSGTPGTGDTVQFGNNSVPLDRLNPDNDLLNDDLSPISLNIIQFSGNQQFILDGNALVVTGGIVNNSSVSQTIDMPILLGANQSFNAATGALVFSNTINGGFDLSLSGSNSITFGAAVGGSTPLNSLLSSASTPVAINAGSVINAGEQTYNGIVTTTGPTTLNAGTGSISAINTGNNFTGALTLMATGTSVAVRDTDDLTLAIPTLGTNTSISAIAGTTLTLPVTSLNTGTGSINFQSSNGTLVTAGSLTTTSGSVTLHGATGLAVSHNITTTTGPISLTGGLAGGVTVSPGVTVNAGSSTILIDGNDSAIILNGALTTTNNTATAIRIIDGTTATLGAITANSGTVVLGEAGGNNLSGVVSSSSVISALTIIGNTGSTVSLIGSNTIANLGAFTSNGDFELIDLGGLTLTGDLATNGGIASISTTANPLTLTASINTGGGGLSLSGVGVDQDSGTILASTATINGGSGTISLESTTNDFTGAVTLNATGAFVSIRDTNDLTLAAPTLAPTTDITAIAGNTLFLPAFDFTAGTRDINFQSLNGALVTNGSLTTSGDGTVSLSASGGLTVAHNITNDAGAITLTGSGVTVNAGITVNAGSSTILVDANNGAIALSGALTTTNDTSTAIRLIDASTALLGNITTGAAGTLVLGEAGADNLNLGVSQTPTGIINVGTLTGTTNSTVELINSNTIANLGTFTSNGNFILNDLGGLTLTGPLTTNGGLATLTTTGLLALGGNNIITANGNVSLTGIGVTSLIASTVDAGSGTILVDANDGAINLAGALTTTNNGTTAVRIIDATTVSLGNITTGATGTVVLGEALLDNLSGPVSQTGVINAGTLIGNTGSTVTLLGNNNLSNVGTFSSNGNFNLNDLLGLALNGSLTMGANFTVNTTGSLTNTPGNVVSVQLDASMTATNAIILNNNATDQLAVLGNASFTGSSITIGSAGLANFGSLTFNSGGSVQIQEDSASEIAGTNTANSLALISAGAITDATGTSITVTGLANLNAGANDITLGDNAGDTTNFGTLTITGGAVNIQEDSGTEFTGINNAASLALVSNGAITDALGTSLTVTGLANLNAGGNAITLGDNGTDITNFGSLTITGGVVNIQEDSSTEFAGINNATSLMLTSSGAITDAAVTSLTVTGLANLNAGANAITLGDNVGDTTNFGSLTITGGVVNIQEDSGTEFAGINNAASLMLISNGAITDANATSLSVTGLANLNAGTNAITLGDNAGDTTNFGSLTVTGGAVNIQEDSDSVLTGSNQAVALALSSTGSISDATDASIQITNNASFTATTTIVLNEQLGDTLNVGGVAVFSGSTVTVGSAGAANFGSLTFNSAGMVTIQEDSSTQLVGSSTASVLALTSAGAITDDIATSVNVAGNAKLDSGVNSVTLGDNAADTTNFGSLTISAGAVNIQEDSSTEFSGLTAVTSLTLASEGAITNTTNASILVNGLASFNSGATNNITLGDKTGDNIRFGSLNIARALNVSVREDDGTVISGANEFDGTRMVIEANGSLEFADSDTSLSATSTTSRAIFIADEVGGVPGVSEFNKDTDPPSLNNSGSGDPIRDESASINYDIDAVTGGRQTPILISVSNTLRSPNNSRGSFISPIHSEGDPVQQLEFNFFFSGNALDLIHTGGNAQFNSFTGDTAIFFSSAPIIDFAIGDAAEQARNFLKRGVNPSVANVGKIGASIDRASVAKSDGLAEYAGPFWTIGYDYDLYDLNKDTVPGLPFPLYYLYTGDVLENPKNSVNLLE